MSKYQLSFWFEHGGFCIWGKNDKAKKEYGYAIKNDALPISESITIELNALEEEYATYLDWDCPQNPSLWTEEHKADFVHRAQRIYDDLVKELGEDYTVINEVSSCVH